MTGHPCSRSLLLLMLLIGVVDLGRGFYYAIGIRSATRAAALSASRDPEAAASRATVRQRVCNETGWVAYGDAAACTGLTALRGDVHAQRHDRGRA